MIKMPDYKLYRIHWLDSTSVHGWMLKSELKQFDLNVYGVGYLVQECENYFMFSAQIGDECFDSPICIPKCVIISITEIAYDQT